MAGFPADTLLQCVNRETDQIKLGTRPLHRNIMYEDFTTDDMKL